MRFQGINTPDIPCLWVYEETDAIYLFNNAEIMAAWLVRNRPELCDGYALKIWFTSEWVNPEITEDSNPQPVKVILLRKEEP